MDLADKMIRETARMSEKLNEKNQKIFTNIVFYIRTSELDNLDQEEVISDILEMFLRYQSEEKEINEEIGDDCKAFCDSIIESIRPKKYTRVKLFEFTKMVFESMMMLLTIDFAFSYLPKILDHGGFGDYAMDAYKLIIGVSIIAFSIFVVNYLGQNSFKPDTKKNIGEIVFVMGFFMMIFLFTAVFGTLSEQVLFSFNLYYLITLIFFYWIYKFAARYVR